MTFVVRDEREYWRKSYKRIQHFVDYIECNPVKAGLVEQAEDYPWSSANPAQRLDTIVEAGRGRDAGYPAPPAQTRAGAANAHGSCLGSVSRNSGD